MFELSLLSSTIRPRQGRWSNSLLALLATGVIALVVWLVILFFSVTEGLEKGWINRLTALHGQLRITPTEGYFQSYGTQVQHWSEQTHWRAASIPALWKSSLQDPYDPLTDGELPEELEAARSAPDAFPLQTLRQVLQEVGVQSLALPYQASVGVLHLQGRQASWTQPIVAASWASTSPAFRALLQPTTPAPDQLLSGASRAPWPVVLPQIFQESGARPGDRGTINTSSMGGAGLQESRTEVVVVGFYDAGVMPVGGRILLTPQPCVEQIGAATSLLMAPSLQGIQLHGLPLEQALPLKQRLVEALTERGVSHCWKIETYRELDFAQELFQQFTSDRLLFSLIAILVLGVACANIISFLVLLVHEKRREIGILRAMGASTLSLALVFGGAGTVLGLAGALLGTLLASISLTHLDTLVNLLSSWQGHPAFSAAFFGGRLPNEMSLSALRFVWLVTPLLAFVSGLLPAWRACRVEPSAILKAE